MLFVLGKEHCLDVMINVYKNNWRTASEVARDLKLHIATAVKYLSELYSLKLVNRRIRKGKTREAFEYQLKSPRVKIEFDVASLPSKNVGTENKPLVLFSVLFTLLLKSRKVVGQSVDVFVDGRFEKLKNVEKGLVKDSLMIEGDLEDAKNIFIKNLNGLTLTEKRTEDVIRALTDLINSVIEHYESRLGQHSTESLVDVTMQKVIDTFGEDLMVHDSALSTLPYDYFGKWREEQA